MQPPTPQRLAELESLAALLDGRLAGEQRERALASLEFNEDDQELLAEAMAVMAEVECGDAEPDDDEPMYGKDAAEIPVVPPGSVASGKAPADAVPMPHWLRAPWLIATSALLVALAVWVVNRPSLGGRIEDLKYSQLQDRLGQTFWGVMRGPGEELDPISSRQGSLHVDLLIALRAGDAERSKAILHTLKNEMGEESLEWAAWYQGVELALESGRPPAELLESFEDEDLENSKDQRFKDAQCLRTAMLAAIQGEKDFFEDDGMLKECPVLKEHWPSDPERIDFTALEARLDESLREATAHQ
jgi:hypothetical protein